MMLVAPFLMLGGLLEMKFQADGSEKINAMQREANLLCGDAINNFKTIQSFGNEDQVIEKYRELLMPALKETKKNQIGLGFAYGMT